MKAGAVVPIPKPELIIHAADLPATARAGQTPQDGASVVSARCSCEIISGKNGLPEIRPLTAQRVVIEAHNLCQPVQINSNGRKEVTLSDRLATIVLNMDGDWGLRPLYGITSAPLLKSDGGIRTIDGYGAESGISVSIFPPWCCPRRHHLAQKRRGRCSICALRSGLFRLGTRSGTSAANTTSMSWMFASPRVKMRAPFYPPY